MSEKKEKTAEKKRKNASAENEAKKTRSRVLYVLLGLAVFAFAVYAAVTLLNLHAQIQERRQELSDIQSEITVQEIKNDEMSKLYNYSDDEFSAYVEQIARDDLDYVKSGERVFVNVSGD